MRRAVLAVALCLAVVGCKTLGDIIDQIPVPSPQPTVEPSLPPSPDPSPSTGPDPVPSPSPSAGPDPAPSPSPSAGPDPVPTPTPKPCDPTKRVKDNPPGCSMCAAIIAWEVEHGGLTRDAQGRLYNGDPPKRYYIDAKTCDRKNEAGRVTHTADEWFRDQLCKPLTCPSPAPTPVPSPTPAPTPTPESGEEWCTLAPGALNWPLMPGSDKQRSEGGVCPPCWSKHPEQIVTRCGIRHIRTIETMGGAGRRYVFDTTCHSEAPRCPHRPNQRTCDVLWACQPHEPAMYQTGPGFELEKVDRRSDNFYLGQINITKPEENGDYEVWVCPPGVRPDGPGGNVCDVWRGYVGTDGAPK